MDQLLGRGELRITVPITRPEIRTPAATAAASGTVTCPLTLVEVVDEAAA